MAQGWRPREDPSMKHFFRLAALAGLALSASATPADAHGAFGLFYDRCNKCCSGCPRPWNAFSAVCCQPGCGQPNPGPMPCEPYQGPGDPRAGRRGLHGFFCGYGCGMPGVGCGMGQGLGGKIKGLFHKGCADEGCADGGCATGGCAAPGGCAAAPQAPTGVVPVSYQHGLQGYYAPTYPTYQNYSPAWGYGYPIGY